MATGGKIGDLGFPGDSVVVGNDLDCILSLLSFENVMFEAATLGAVALPTIGVEEKPKALE